jgi:YVTN family beta-propeller protein
MRKVWFLPGVAVLFCLVQPNQCKAETRAYVANSADDTVSVIVKDTTKDSPPWEELTGPDTRIEVDAAPAGVAASADGDYVYVTNGGERTVSVIRTSSSIDAPYGEVVATVPVGMKPSGVAVSPNGDYVYVTNRLDDTVSVISKYTHEAITDWRETTGQDDRIKVGTAPIGVAVSPDGKYLYVANHHGNSVSVIDTSDGTVIDTVKEVGRGPVGVAVSPNGDHVYVTNQLGGTVSVISKHTAFSTEEAPTWEEVTGPYNRINVGTAPIGVAVSPGGDHVYVANRGDDTVSVIRTSDNSVVKPNDPVAVGDSPIGVAFTPNGDYVFVTNRGDDTGEGSVSIIDTSTIDKPEEAEVTVHTIELVELEPSSFGQFIVSIGYPERPSGLTATAVPGSQIRLSWTDNSSDELGSRIERKEGSFGTYEQLKDVEVGANETEYTDTGLKESTTYYYQIWAYNGSGDSDYSNEANATTCPAAPSELSATAVSGKQVDLSWADNSSGESGFKIERKTGSDGTYRELAVKIDPNGTSHSDKGLDESTTYHYRVRAYDNDRYSDYSNVGSATTYLAAPSGLSCAAVSSSQIDLSWTKEWTDGSSEESGFKIERRQVSEETTTQTGSEEGSETDSEGSYTEIAKLKADVKSFRDTDLEPYTIYRYRVRAYNSGGDSDYTGEIEARTKDDCFIATAAYGSLVEPQVATLRNFRDGYLLPNAIGRMFVKTYYACSPPIADFIADHDTLRAGVRMGLLPLVAFSYSTLHLGLTLTLTILVSAMVLPVAFFWFWQRKKATPAT